jgi:hypothetical protein
LDEDPLEEAETNQNAQPGVKLALKPSEFKPHSNLFPCQFTYRLSMACVKGCH